MIIRLFTIFVLVFALVAATTSAARADFATGFESSSGYTAGKTAIGVHDSGSSGGAAWAPQGNVMTDDMVIISEANPAEGSAHLRLTDRDVNNGVFARIDLSDSIDVTRPFVIQFSFAIPEDSDGGNFSFTFGEKWADNLAKNWLTFFVATGGASKNELWALIDNGSDTPITVPLIKDYTRFADPGDYLTIKVNVDPDTMTYTSFVISGRKDSANRIAAFEGKQVPWKSGLPGQPKSSFTISSSKGNVGVIDVDKISITQLPK